MISDKNFSINEYKFPNVFENSLFKGILSIKKAKNERNKISNLINELEKK